MKTLIELYDERPIENILATEVFRPERTVFLCPAARGAQGIMIINGKKTISKHTNE